MAMTILAVREGVMFNRLWLWTALLSAFAALLVAPAVSFAQDFTDADTREVTSYVLTEKGLEQFTQASKNLGSLAKEILNDCDDSDDSDGSDNLETLDDMVAHMDSIPGVTEAIESAGMSNREYIVFSLSIFQNAMAAWVVSETDGELPPDVSMANVEFYQSHEAEIQQAGAQMESGDCDEDDANDDEEEWSDEDQ